MFTFFEDVVPFWWLYSLILVLEMLGFIFVLFKCARYVGAFEDRPLRHSVQRKLAVRAVKLPLSQRSALHFAFVLSRVFGCVHALSSQILSRKREKSVCKCKSSSALFSHCTLVEHLRTRDCE
jgi:hypothetical protein